MDGCTAIIEIIWDRTTTSPDIKCVSFEFEQYTVLSSVDTHHGHFFEYAIVER